MMVTVYNFSYFICIMLTQICNAVAVAKPMNAEGAVEFRRTPGNERSG
jgi:hypothetical protein